MNKSFHHERTSDNPRAASPAITLYGIVSEEVVGVFEVGSEVGFARGTGRVRGGRAPGRRAKIRFLTHSIDDVTCTRVVTETGSYIFPYPVPGNSVGQGLRPIQSRTEPSFLSSLVSIRDLSLIQAIMTFYKSYMI